MSDNPFREALAKKERDGGWASPGKYRWEGKGCLIANLPLNLQGCAEDEAFDLLSRVCSEQTGEDEDLSIVRAHNNLSGPELDRIMEKCAVAWDERV